MNCKTSSNLSVGCQDFLTDKQLCEMIADSILEHNCLPTGFLPGSCIKVEINFEFSIPDYPRC